jgi:uncharacterized protein YukE
MITMQGSVPYPTTADSRPIRALAADLKQMGSGLGQGSEKLLNTATNAQTSWVGLAAQAFVDQMNKRATTIDDVARTIASAATPLQTLAAAIDSTSAAYSSAVVAENAARAGLPWTSAALAAAIAAELAAVTALEAAGLACAGALVVIEAKVAAGEYLLHSMNTTKGSTTPQTTPAPQTTTPSTAATPKTETASTDWDHLVDEVVHAVERGLHIAEPALEGSMDGLKHALEHNTQTYVRNGRTFQRWAANQGGPRLGLTATEAAATTTGAVARWAQRLPAVGVALAGVTQTMEDNRNARLTTTQRVGRTSAAVLFEGGGAVVGAEAGATAGATAGAAVGAFFGGVGAVPGAVVGGAVGAVGGAFLGSSAGHAAKEWLFNWNPQGAFK